MLLQACPNGARRPGDHPALPVTPAAVARDAVSLVAAGAGALHVHPKDAAGADSLHAADVAAVVSAVRAAVPGVPVGVTTGAWVLPDTDARVAAVRAWTDLPDFASVNWHEDGADDVAAALLDRGVQVEAGLWHLEGVAAWQASPHRDRCLRVLLELPDGLDEAGAQAEAERLLAAVAGGPPVLLHGEGTSCWAALRLALRRGLDTRIGLEDVLHLPDGSPARDNAALVRAATAVLASVRAAGGTDG
ncbi:hypothetical protein DQ239_16130 [Blastococcus sp. TF02-09]|uniref:3-keto-5-aminohexanoate cleavage protein n=1 Tax=Blastococcus sp. TF02-09 TaxID=2250576 RepID=UPI000DEB607E|nr:3-keto-5-aminohexanoate cleavage protein [Blastococcus sp. TF02-9]RBY75609.1 hypothetical protein DQ239_16130 [Blastococcus sp. TF02-9]